MRVDCIENLSLRAHLIRKMQHNSWIPHVPWTAWRPRLFEIRSFIFRHNL